MSEKYLRKRVVQLLKPLRAFAVENAVGVDGVPDVCCLTGWIELKLANLPTRASTRVSVDLRPAQRVWLRNWREGGGRAFTLTVIDQTWYLHDGAWSAKYLGEVPIADLIAYAIAIWPHGPSQEDFVSTLVNWKYRLRSKDEACSNGS